MADIGKDKIIAKILFVAKLKASAYLESPEASECLAVIEYFAAATGKPAADLPAEAVNWLKQNGPLAAVDRGVI